MLSTSVSVELNYLDLLSCCDILLTNYKFDVRAKNPLYLYAKSTATLWKSIPC
jgi:hypothetical protein